MQQAIDNKKQIEELVPKIKSMMDSLLGTSDDRENVPVHKYAEREKSRRREFKRSVTIRLRLIYTGLMFWSVCRSLDKTRQKLEGLSDQNVLVRFLSNADQREEIVGTVEDVREAILNYQVFCRMLNCPSLTDNCNRHLYRWICMKWTLTCIHRLKNSL